MYLHCCSHSLNLAISDACDVKSIRNAVGIIQTVCSFFNTPKRQAVLQNAIEKIAPSSKKTKLKTLCPTRWVERHEAKLVFLELFDSIIDSLETISSWFDRETSSKANSILLSLKQGDYFYTHSCQSIFIEYAIKSSTSKRRYGFVHVNGTCR